MSVTATMPWEDSSRPNSTSCWAVSSVLVSGMTAVTRLRAFSRSTPVGSPFSSRSITPPSGSGVSRVMPASSSALLFTQRTCAQARRTHTGVSEHPRSRSHRVGERCSANFASS